MSDSHEHEPRCICCETGISPAERALITAQEIRETGKVHVQTVASTDGSFNWAYTIGLAQHELPEIIAFSKAGQDFLFRVVATTANRAMLDDELHVGIYDDLLTEFQGNKMLMEVVDVDVPKTIDEYMGMGARVHEILGHSGWTVKQVFWPDRAGRVPSDPNYDQENWPQLSLRIVRH